MKIMGRRDVKTAMHYQHPELEIVPAALDDGATSVIGETECKRSSYGCGTPGNHNGAKLLTSSSNLAAVDSADS